MLGWLNEVLTRGCPRSYKARCVAPLQPRRDCLYTAGSGTASRTASHKRFWSTSASSARVQVLVNVFSGVRSASFPAVVPGAFVLGQVIGPVRQRHRDRDFGGLISAHNGQLVAAAGGTPSSWPGTNTGTMAFSWLLWSRKGRIECLKFLRCKRE